MESVLQPAPTKSESILMSLKKSLIGTSTTGPLGKSFSKYYQESDELPKVLIDESEEDLREQAELSAQAFGENEDTPPID